MSMAVARATTRTIKVPRIQYRNFEVEVEPHADGGEAASTRFHSRAKSRCAASRGIPGRTTTRSSLTSPATSTSHGRRMVSRSSVPPALLHFGSVNEVTLDEKKKRLRGMAAFSSIPWGRSRKRCSARDTSRRCRRLPGPLDGAGVERQQDRHRHVPLPLDALRGLHRTIRDYKVGFGRTRSKHARSPTSTWSSSRLRNL